MECACATSDSDCVPQIFVTCGHNICYKCFDEKVDSKSGRLKCLTCGAISCAISVNWSILDTKEQSNAMKNVAGCENTLKTDL